MKWINLLVLAFSLLLSACDRPADEASQHLLLVFGDQEKDVEPYRTRILVTPEYMRFDDGEGSVDYLLFDRRARTIYNVIQENRSVTVIAAEPADVKPPFDLKLSHKRIQDMQDAPTIDGIKPQHHVYLAGDETCFEVLAAPGFLPAFVEAMKEFNTVLADDSAITLASLPADMQNGCSLAKSIFAPNRHFQAGFPLQRWSPDGSSSVLLDFKKDYQADKTLFSIPDGYQRLNIQEIRGSLSGQ